MWLTVMNHNQFVKNPFLNLEAKVAFNPESLMLLQGIRAVAFGQAGKNSGLFFRALRIIVTNMQNYIGSICDCGKKIFFFLSLLDQHIVY
jgi:hypothetical protein